MKKILAVLILLFSIPFFSHAVLKENGLARTLSVLRAELKYACEQQRQLDAYELQVENLHQQLIGYMTRSEQVALVRDVIFKAVEGVGELTGANGNLQPFMMPSRRITFLSHSLREMSIL